MIRLERRVIPILLGALLALVSGPAAARSLAIEDFRATIEVDPGGEIRVEERLEIDFRGTWNGIFREIPERYTYPSGLRGSIRLTVDAVEDGEGNALEYWETRRKGIVKLKIRVPQARDAVRTVVLRYHAEDVIRRYNGKDSSFGAHDELYWNVTGNGWQAPIRRASVEVQLPGEIPADAIRHTAYTGRLGARGENYEVSRLPDRRLVFRTTRELGEYRGLTIAVGFPPGFVAQPSMLQRARWLIEANWSVGIPLGLLALWFAIWWFRGRDPSGDRTIVPEWEPPMGLRPSEVGVLIDDRMDQRDLTASIFDLAVRGVISIRSEAGPDDFVLVLNEQALDGAGLETFEEALIDGLFGGESEVRLGSLKRKFYKKAMRVNRKVLDDLVVKGLFRASPDRVRLVWVALTVVMLLGTMAVGFMVSAPVPYWVALVLVAPAMFGLAWQMPRRTKTGLEALARIKGMEEYLATAERDRMEQLSLSQVERLLPYAIALNLHDRWTDAFAGLFEQPPQWYVAGATGWQPYLLSSIIGDLDRSVSKNLFSVPRTESSGSSGGGSWSGGSGFSSGGGSSGGGFGGGGGGGW
jgi:uncharacterized membrane protein YgcG